MSIVECIYIGFYFDKNIRFLVLLWEYTRAFRSFKMAVLNILTSEFRNKVSRIVIFIDCENREVTGAITKQKWQEQFIFLNENELWSFFLFSFYVFSQNISWLKFPLPPFLLVSTSTPLLHINSSSIPFRKKVSLQEISMKHGIARWNKTRKTLISRLNKRVQRANERVRKTHSHC